MADEIVKDIEMLSGKRLLGSLKDAQVRIMTNTKVNKITSSSSVTVVTGNKEKQVKADIVVTAVGNKSAGQGLYEKIKKLGYNISRIGDAKQVGKIIDAVSDGYNISTKL